MTNHISDWRISMEAKGNTTRHIRNFAANVKRLAAACEWSHLTEISADNVKSWLAGQRQAGTSASTINAVLRARKAFALGLSRRSA